MRYMIYWELDPDKNITDIADLASKLFETGSYPASHGKILGWYVTSSIPMWGITLVEYSEEASSKDVFGSLLEWIKAMPGVFKVHKIAPYVTAKEAVQLAQK